MRSLILFCLLLVAACVYSQSPSMSAPLNGTYMAEFGGDVLTLNLKPSNSSTYTGEMKDSQQTYAVELRQKGNTVEGSAVESTMGLVFTITGTTGQDAMSLHFEIDLFGKINSMDIVFTKPGSASSASLPDASNSDLTFPAGAEHPQALTGTWTHEQLYQSGYGDNGMSAGFSESMTFLPDGHLAEGGSNTYISGSNYSGQSAGAGSGIVPGVVWYTIGNQLYMIVNENGTTETVHLGKYYIEDGHLLITTLSGEKLLLSKSN